MEKKLVSFLVLSSSAFLLSVGIPNCRCQGQSLPGATKIADLKWQPSKVIWFDWRDNHRILYTHLDSRKNVEIVTLDTATGKETVHATLSRAAGATIRSAIRVWSLSPNGSQLLWLDERDARHNNFAWVVSNLQGAEIRRWKSDRFLGGAYWRNDSSAWTEVRSTLGGQRRLRPISLRPEAIEHPLIGSDKRTAYDPERNGINDLRGDRQATVNSYFADHPSYDFKPLDFYISPDRSHAAVFGTSLTGRPGAFKLCLLKRNGQKYLFVRQYQTTRSTDIPQQTSHIYCWTPDSRRFSFLTNEGLYAISVTATSPSR